MFEKNTIKNEEDFNKHIDILALLISNTIKRRQYGVAEKYLKYFFEVMIKYYHKKSLPIQSNENQLYVFENSGEERNNNSININSFDYFRIHNQFNTEDKFLDHIINILSDTIRSNQHNVFVFILDLYKDTIRRLVKSEKTTKQAYSLIHHFKFISNEILTNLSNNNGYANIWFKDETFRWFIDLYNNSTYRVEDIQVYETELLFVFRRIVDDNDVDLFKRFLSSLSTSFFIYDFQIEDLIKKLKNKYKEIDLY